MLTLIFAQIFLAAKKPYYQRTVSDSFDSLEDEMPSKSKSSTTNHDLAQQNKDGFGSYGQWNFVYKNLEQQGYNKDLGERGDIVMEDKMREISIREQERADRAEEKAFRVSVL